MKAIADTGFLVAFANRSDQHHEWALHLAERVTEPLLTCEAVLAETDRLVRLAIRYAGRQPDFADLCLIRVSELHPKHSVVTVDVGDLRVYRRNQREIVPLIHPPGL